MVTQRVNYVETLSLQTTLQKITVYLYFSISQYPCMVDANKIIKKLLKMHLKTSKK